MAAMRKTDAATKRAASKPAKKIQSMYENYRLPFFDGKRLSRWSVSPTGEYDDFERRRHALEFIRSCDRTNGWITLLPGIVGDIVGSWSGNVGRAGKPRRTAS